MTPPMTYHSEPAREAVARALHEHFGTSSTTMFTAREAGRQAASVALRHLSAAPAPAVKIFNVGDRTLAQVFRPAGLTDVSDLQAVLDAVEVALAPAAGVEAVRATLEDVYVGKRLLDYATYQNILSALTEPKTSCCKGLAPLSECQCEKDRHAALSPSTPAATSAETDDIAVDRFAAAMKAKLAKKRAEGRGGWEDKEDCSNAFLSQLLREHVDKGDPVDVGNLTMMIHQRGERIG